MHTPVMIRFPSARWPNNPGEILISSFGDTCHHAGRVGELDREEGGRRRMTKKGRRDENDKRSKGEMRRIKIGRRNKNDEDWKEMRMREGKNR